jgi:predicted AAA+ superfamily ATPase
MDFLLYNANDEIVPVEVGLGQKSKKQLNNAIRKYRANHGILISNLTEKIEKEDNIIKIPWITFSFL